VARSDNKILALLGFSCTGDCGPWTFYTSERKQIVFFARMPALNPASPLQLLQRQAWTAAAVAWKNKTPQQRADWEAAVRRTSCKITGYNLWVFTITTGRTDAMQTISRQAGIALSI